jgi:hypothetical protein
MASRGKRKKAQMKTDAQRPMPLLRAINGVSVKVSNLSVGPGMTIGDVGPGSILNITNVGDQVIGVIRQAAYSGHATDQTGWTVKEDVDRPTAIDATSLKSRPRAQKKREEMAAALSLATEFQRSRGGDWCACVKVDSAQTEDEVDAFLISNEGKRINWQVRHLDSDLITSLGRDGEVSDHGTAEIAEKVRGAILAKTTGVRRNDIGLVLYTPVSLGGRVKSAIMQETFSDGGFREVWIAPEEPDSAFKIKTDAPSKSR